MITHGLMTEVAVPSPTPRDELTPWSNTNQYRALFGVRGKGMASRTLARPVT